MKRTISAAILVCLVVLASPASASDKPFSFVIGGGVTSPVGGVGDSLGRGGQVTLGLGYKVRPQITVFGEYNFSSLGQKKIDIPQPTTAVVKTFSGSGWYQYGGGGIAFTPWQSGKASAHIVGAVAIYHRAVYVSTPATGLVAVCNPDWFVCFPDVVTVDKVVASRGSTDPGVSVGGGFTYRFSALASFFVEARFHHVWGPDAQTQSGGTKKATAQFLPITFGLRF